MSLRCVIVDDSPGFLRSARTLLERQGVAVVGVASSAADAVERANELGPDVVLVDIDLGEENGFDVARLIQTSSRLEPGRIIMISTHAEEDFADLIAASPVAGFVAKADLSLSAIRELLGQTRPT